MVEQGAECVDFILQAAVELADQEPQGPRQRLRVKPEAGTSKRRPRIVLVRWNELSEYSVLSRLAIISACNLSVG